MVIHKSREKEEMRLNYHLVTFHILVILNLVDILGVYKVTEIFF